MRKVIVTAFACLFAVLAASPLFALDGKTQGGPGGKAGAVKPLGVKRLEMMSRELDLTPEQKEKISVILKESREKAASEMRKVRKVVDTILAESEKSIQAVLTPEQAQKYEQIKAERKAQRDKRRQQRAAENKK